MWWYDVLALLVVALLAAYGLRLYHVRRGQALDQRHAKHHGWRKVTLTVRHEVWVCPDCGGLVPTWQDVLNHQSLTSPCGRLGDTREAEAKAELAQAAMAGAAAAGRWSASAVYDDNATTGAVDTLAVEGDGGGDD